MNNLDWYTKVTLFCRTYQSCSECPFFILQAKESEIPFEEKQCFSTKQALNQLSSWLSESTSQDREPASCNEIEDNQWLKDLLKGQFGDEGEDLDAFYLDDDFI